MPGFFDLLKQSFSEYKPNWRIYVRVLVRAFFYGFVAAMVPVIIGLLAFLLIPKPLSFIVIALCVVAVIVAMVYVQSWQMLALAKVVVEGKNGKVEKKSGEIFSSVKPLVVSYFVVTMIATFVNFAGLILFIVPAVIFSVWFCLTTFTFLVDQKRGISTLILSREYVRGYGMKVFLYFIFYSIIQYGVLTFLPTYIFEQLNMSYLGNIVSLLLTPVVIPVGMIFVFNMYAALKSAKGDIVVDYTAARKRKYYALVVLPIVFIIAMIVLSINVLGRLGGIDLPSSGEFAPEDFDYQEEWNEPTELDTLS